MFEFQLVRVRRLLQNHPNKVKNISQGWRYSSVVKYLSTMQMVGEIFVYHAKGPEARSSVAVENIGEGEVSIRRINLPHK